MAMSGTPVLILKEGTERQRGREAYQRNIAVAKAVAEAVRTTLGPRGMDKMLVNSLGDVIITNDGATILKEMDVQHPAAKMMVEISKTMDQECGDGTTTAVVLAGELLKKAEDLIDQDIHPTVVANGYRMAQREALRVMDAIATRVSPDDEQMLRRIATTAMMSKAVSTARDHFAKLAVDAVLSIAEEKDGKKVVDLDSVQFVKKAGASLLDTSVVKGVIIEKEPVHPGMPKKVEKAKIALVKAGFEIKKTEVESKIQIRDPKQMKAFLEEEEAQFRRMVERVKKSGATVLFCEKAIEDMAQHFLAKEGILAVRRVKESDMEKLSLATGARIVGKAEELEAADLGYAEMVEARKIEEDWMIFVSGCKNPRAVSIFIRGGTKHVLEEAERSLDDALNVVRLVVEDGRIVPGGGATAVELALALREYAVSVGGREQMAVNAFADALECIPTALAENAGLDPIDILIEMRKAHKDGKKDAGVDVFSGKIVSMMEKNVIEPIRVGQQAISSATDAAIMIMRIDDIIAAKGTSKEEDKDKDKDKKGSAS
ncbi:MAG: thermosome subunit beta [Methanomassiliicoccales archaeon]